MAHQNCKNSITTSYHCKLFRNTKLFFRIIVARQKIEISEKIDDIYYVVFSQRHHFEENEVVTKSQQTN